MEKSWLTERIEAGEEAKKVLKEIVKKITANMPSTILKNFDPVSIWEKIPTQQELEESIHADSNKHNSKK